MHYCKKKGDPDQRRDARRDLPDQRGGTLGGTTSLRGDPALVCADLVDLRDEMRDATVSPGHPRDTREGHRVTVGAGLVGAESLLTVVMYMTL